MKKALAALLIGGVLLAKQLPIVDTQTIYINDNDNFEPSGLAFYDNRLLSVSDNGRIYSLKDGISFVEKLKKRDYEGMTFNDDGSRLFVAEEGKDNIIELTTTSPFKRINKFDINRKFNGEKVIHKKGNGLESLAFVSETEDKLYFYTANQSKKFEGKDKSAILFVEVDKNTKEGTIIKYFPMKIKDISSMLYKSDSEIYFLSDKQDTLFLTDSNFKNMIEYDLPGQDQEGLAFDFENNYMYIAQDSGNILKIKLSKGLK